MSNPEAQRWNERYRHEHKFWIDRQPRQLLRSYEHLLPHEGRALDAASGMGINALFLAQHGLRVIAFDISEYALNQAKQRSLSEDIPIEAVVYDLTNPWLPPDYFDVILNFHFLERAAIPIYRQTLSPGGLIYFDTYFRIGESNKPIYYLESKELLNFFEDFEVIHYIEETLPESENHSQRGLAQLVARKPSQT